MWRDTFLIAADFFQQSLIEETLLCGMFQLAESLQRTMNAVSAVLFIDINGLKLCK